MSKQDRIDLINQRLEILGELNQKIDKIIAMMESKKYSEPDIEFIPANNVNNTFAKNREKEIFKELDGKR